MFVYCRVMECDFEVLISLNLQTIHFVIYMIYILNNILAKIKLILFQHCLMKISSFNFFLIQ